MRLLNFFLISRGNNDEGGGDDKEEEGGGGGGIIEDDEEGEMREDEEGGGRRGERLGGLFSLSGRLFSCSIGLGGLIGSLPTIDEDRREKLGTENSILFLVGVF